MGDILFGIGPFIGVVFIILLAVIGPGIATSKSPVTNIRPDAAFTRRSESGSTDPLSEGLMQSEIQHSDTGRADVPKPSGKPLIDVSVAPIKRGIPPTTSGRSVHYWR